MNTNMWFALYQGGPQVFAWSIVIVYFGAIAQAASLSEMASTIPIAGAQYHWTWNLAPGNIKRFATWVQGYSTVCRTRPSLMPDLDMHTNG
jgi:choline transport protein